MRSRGLAGCSSLVLALTASAAACTAGSGPRPVRPSQHATVVHRQPAGALTTVEPGLVWAEGRVPAAVVRAVASVHAARIVAVANGTAWLPAGRRAPRGMAYPIDVSAADPRKYATVVPGALAAMRTLSAGHVLLGAESARLRGLHAGDRTHIGGLILKVAAIVPDAVIGDAEMFVTPADGQRLHLPPDRYLLVQPPSTSSWASIAAALKRAAPPGTRMRLRAPGTARMLHEASAVLTSLEEKLRFGEFAALPRATAAGYLTVDPDWQANHLSTVAMPILGPVTCNRAFMPSLRAALRAVVRQHLQRLINPRDYGGCYAPRLIPGHPGQELSHHAFGSAIDINVHANPQGRGPHPDPRLVRIFARYGLIWGGRFLVPDGMHFEALGR
jgi:hypothetical protein